MEGLELNWKWVRRALFLIGLAGILSGIGVAIYSAFVLRPRIAALTNEVQGSLQDVERLTDMLGKDDRLLSASFTFAQSGSRVIALLPETLTRVKATLLNASSASVAAGDTAEEGKKGITGLVAPKKELGRTDATLKNTARQMDSLAASINRLAHASAGFAKATQSLTQRVSTIQPQLTSRNGLLPSARHRAQSLERAIRYSLLPTQAMLLGFGLSALLFLSGLVSLLFALALKAPAVLAAGGTQPLAEGAKRVA